jgi:hypothetical protein
MFCPPRYVNKSPSSSSFPFLSLFIFQFRSHHVHVHTHLFPVPASLFLPYLPSVPSHLTKLKTPLTPPPQTQRGAFTAFSTGFRACLGRKFAQVELATLLGVLLREHRIELVREGRETVDATRAKALRSIDDRHTGVAMRMRGRVRVRFVRR